MRPFSLGSIVLESPETLDEEALRLESQRLEAEAMRKELVYQLHSAKEAIEKLQKSHRKYQKQIVRLENECRELEAENQQLRRELELVKREVSRKGDLSPPPCQKVSTCAQVCTSKPRNDSKPILTDIHWKLGNMYRVLCEQGPKTSCCLAMLRKTRQDNAMLLEAVGDLQEVVGGIKKDVRVSTLPEICSEDIASDLSYERGEECNIHLFTEIQDMTDSEVALECHIFKGRPELDDSFLVAAPMKSKVEQMEAEIMKIQAKLQANNTLLRSTPPLPKKRRSSLGLRSRRHMSSLARAYHKALSQPWSLLV